MSNTDDSYNNRHVHPYYKQRFHSLMKYQGALSYSCVRLNHNIQGTLS